jgi:DNA-directed RNA polymerase specialized sigma24 family protein
MERKYELTPAMDESIREAYRRYHELKDRQALAKCAKRLALPSWVVIRRGGTLGLAHVKESPWSDGEIGVLEKYGHLTDAVIRRKLKDAGYQRSITAIHSKLKRLRVKRNLEGYSAKELADALGTDSHKVANWIRRGMLRATRRGTERTEAQGGDFYWIAHRAVQTFVLRYPEEIDLHRVEKWWFLDLVTNGRICTRPQSLG